MTEPIHYDLQCYTMRLTSARADFSQQLEWFVAPLRLTADAVDRDLPVAEVRCTEVATFDPMAGFDGVEPSPVTFEVYGAVSLLEHADRIRYFVPDSFSLTLHEGDSGASDLAVLPDCSFDHIALCAILALDHSTRAARSCLIHSACLDTPDGRRFVMLAESGVGKTTTSLKLARAGMPLSGDDTTLVWMDGESCVGFGLPRPARVSKDALTRVDGLAGIIDPDAWDHENEQELSNAQLAGFVRLADTAAKPIAAVVRLTRTRTGPAEVFEIDPAAAMSASLAENISLNRSSGMTPHQMERFELYARLFGSARCLQLELGDDDADFVQALNKAVSS